MNANELRRWLAKQGCTFETHRGHLTVRLKDKVSQLPMRGGGKELGTRLVEKIKTDMGLNRGSCVMWYELTLTPDDNDTWFVTAPQFDEVVSYGATKEEACQNGRSAIEEAIAARIANGNDIPYPLKEAKGKGWFVEVPALVFLKSALYMLLKEKGWSRADLMRELKCQREHVDRLFRLDHNSRLDSLEEAFKALGHPLRFDMQFHRAA